MKKFIALSLLTSLLFAACQSVSSDDYTETAPWIHRGVTYPNSAAYLEAVQRDKFVRAYPPEASLADFRSFDDRRLGLYYFHYLRSGKATPAKISPAAEADLREALLDRGFTATQLESIERGVLQKGMPAAALFAAWGPPFESYRTRTSGGETIQHIYIDENGRQISIFTQNGRLNF